MSSKRLSPVGFGAVLISLLALAVARPASADLLYAIDVWDPRLWVIDPTDGSTIGARNLTVNSDTVEGGNGLAIDPNSGEMYGLVKLQNWSERSLVTIDPETGVATVIANLVYPFASITFDDSGTLYGVTGAAQYMSAASRNALFTIDPTDGTLTQECKFASGNQGHALSFGDGLIYHATQDGTDFYGDLILETVDPLNFPVDPEDPCPVSDLDITFDSGGVPVHTQSILVTDTGVSTASLLLAGWHNYTECCASNFYGIAVSGSGGTADLLGVPYSNFKGLAFHTFEPDFVTIGDLTISKVAAKIRDGKERHVLYTIEVSNPSGDDVTNVTLTDYLDTSRLVYVSDDSGCDLLFGSQVDCDLGTIEAGQTRSITIDTTVTCKGKNCTSVDNWVTLRVSLEQWVSDPENAVKSTYISTSLKGKFSGLQ